MQEVISDGSKFEMHVVVSGLKRKGAIWAVIRAQFKSFYLSWCWGAVVPMATFHIWKGNVSAESYKQVLEQHMLPDCPAFSGKASHLSTRRS